MSFVYRCLATENPNKPFVKRCKNAPAQNGILCKYHMDKVRRGPIYVVMHNEVSKTFGIPFRDQVCVSINLSKSNNKPESKSVKEDRIRHTKNHLREKMQDLGIIDLKRFHDLLGLNCWKNMKQGRNDYAFRYMMTKKIIETIFDKSESGKYKL